MTPSAGTPDEDLSTLRSKPTRTLLRGLAVLEAVAESPHSLGPTEIATMVDLDKGTVSRLLNTLDEAGYVRRDATSRTYTLSTKILRLSQGLGEQLDLRGVAHPHLVALCSSVDETVHLGVRDGMQVVYVDKVEPRNQTIRMVSAVGRAMPLQTTALGKAMMSQYSPSALEATLSGIDFMPQSSRSIRDRATLERVLEETRKRGYSIDDRENEDNVTCVGAAILGANHQVIGAISISSPTFRVEGRIQELGSKCRETAETISHEVGATGLLVEGAH